MRPFLQARIVKILFGLSAAALSCPVDDRNWKPTGIPNRYYNDTMRVLGNDVAGRAIAHNKINPWPCRTAFSRIACAGLPMAPAEVLYRSSLWWIDPHVTGLLSQRLPAMVSQRAFVMP